MAKAEPSLDDVRRAMRGPRPGLAAHYRLAPEYRRHLFDQSAPVLPSAKVAAVLLLLYSYQGRLHFPLTLRTEGLESHSGQIALPGGTREDDEPLERTALREAQEELGIDPVAVEVLGSLSPIYIPPSGYLITPFVAFTPQHPDFRPDPREVAEVLEVPLVFFLTDDAICEEQWEFLGGLWLVPLYPIGPHKVWGATAMVLGEFATMVNVAMTPSTSAR
jgi:8-oxo-dGTP pyrophosphatase MutT (NUDIX family)